MTALTITSSCKKDGKPEKHVNEILDHILGTRNLITYELGKKGINASDIAFVTFWDLDGTLLHGDCSEGLKEKNDLLYKGLIQFGIENKLTIYPENGFNDFWIKYKQLDKDKGHYESYTYILKIFKGASVDKVKLLAKEKFNDIYGNYFFSSSLKIFNSLKKENIKNYVISASADFFVKGASGQLKIPSNQIFGIQLKIKDNKLTDQIVKPITYDKGKTHTLKKIIKSIKKNNTKKYVFVLAAFGNSYHTDGDFLLWTARQKLPGGTPISVMINGGKMPHKKYSSFKKVIQKNYRKM